MKYGGNIFIKDRFQNNILHLMCYVINGNPEQEEDARMFYNWLLHNVAKDDIIRLLSDKNSNHVNPETAAMSLGTLGLFLDFLKTKGMYRL